ncbi:MAG: hypothetical protein U1E29_10025 [Coriobacteriia bacterium]|nr:hypothetical protein [Coriobacteriia bacterium]
MPEDAVEQEEQPVEDPPVEEPEPLEDPPAEEPEPAGSPPPPEAPPAEEPLSVEAAVVSSAVRIPWWPTILYSALWVTLSVATVWLLTLDRDIVPLNHEYYPLILLGGLVLTLLGPFLGTVVWAIVWRTAPAEHRGGLLTTSLLRSSAVTLVGVAGWWAMLVLVDAWRLGRL